jgi:hypothetical protein
MQSRLRSDVLATRKVAVETEDKKGIRCLYGNAKLNMGRCQRLRELEEVVAHWAETHAAREVRTTSQILIRWPGHAHPFETPGSL